MSLYTNCLPIRTRRVQRTPALNLLCGCNFLPYNPQMSTRVAGWHGQRCTVAVQWTEVMVGSIGHLCAPWLPRVLSQRWDSKAQHNRGTGGTRAVLHFAASLYASRPIPVPGRSTTGTAWTVPRAQRSTLGCWTLTGACSHIPTPLPR